MDEQTTVESLTGFIENVWPVCQLVLADNPNVRVQCLLRTDKVSDQAWATRKKNVVVTGKATKDENGQIILLDAETIELAPE